MKFCSHCGAAVSLRIPAGDNRSRHVCDGCGVVHYINPRIIAGCLVTAGHRVLLCKRAIEPRKGYWTLPAGFMENGESTEAGAARETLEEANATVAPGALYTVFSLPHISQVYLFYRTTLTDGSYSAGPESLDVRLFAEAEIPWDDLAFPVMRKTLQHYFNDLAAGIFPARSEIIEFKRRTRA